MTAEMDSAQFLALEPLVNAIAGQEWKRSNIFTIEDVAQAIWLHMVEEWKHYADADEGLTKHMARRAARKFCQVQRTKYMHAMGAFLYTPPQVRRFLEEVVWCDPGDCKDVEARVDITEAYSKLSKAQKAAIYKRYALREMLETKAEINAESRAVINITDRLNSGLRLQPDEFDH